MANLRADIRRLLEDEAAIGGGFVVLPDGGKQGLKIKDQDATIGNQESEIRIRDVAVDAGAVAAGRTSEDPWGRLLAQIPAGSPLHELSTLDQVAEYVANSILIPIDETRINPVPGVGNPNADLMVIGEAPGADEDKKGEPFVGRAGQLLDKILAAIDFDRTTVYIANILKSRPPRNRDPQPEEVAAHFPILLRQISIIQPKLILCVGRVAGNNLLGQNTTLKALRQQNFHDFFGIPVMVTYHPAALLRSQNFKRPTWEDVQVLRARYDELTGSDG